MKGQNEDIEFDCFTLRCGLNCPGEFLQTWLRGAIQHALGGPFLGDFPRRIITNVYVLFYCKQIVVADQMTCDQFQMKLGQLPDETVMAQDVIGLFSPEMTRLMGVFSAILTKFSHAIKSRPQLNGAALVQVERSTAAAIANLLQPAIEGVWMFFEGSEDGITRSLAVRTFSNVCKHQALHMWNLVAAAVEQMKGYVRGVTLPHAITPIAVKDSEIYFHRQPVEPKQWDRAARQRTITSTVDTFFAKMNDVISEFEQETLRIQAAGLAGKLLADLREHYHARGSGHSISSGFFQESVAYAYEIIGSAKNEALPSIQHKTSSCLFMTENVAEIDLCFTGPIETVKAFKVRAESINRSVFMMQLELALF